MNKEERIQTVLAGKTPDRLPVAVWRHFSEADYDPVLLAQAQIDFVTKYDYDFVKMMPVGLYSVEDLGAKVHFYKKRAQPAVAERYGINSIDDYQKLAVVDVLQGTYGRQLQFANYLAKHLPKNTPFIQTIFSPLTTLHKLAGDRLLDDLRTAPEAVEHALGVISEITADFVKFNIAAGVSGFFFATQEARKSILDPQQLRRFAIPYDKQVIAEYADKTWFNVLHIHGLDIYFDELLDYPANVLNWHDRNTEPSIAQAKKKTGKTLLAGIRAEHHLVNGKLVFDDIVRDGTPDAIIRHVREAIDEAGGSFIVGPGCVVSQVSPDENLRAVRRAVEL